MATRRPQFVLPDAVDDHLEGLQGAAREEGNRVSRSDIVATLIWLAPMDGDALGVMVREYRRALRGTPSVSAIQYPPGPRPILNEPTQ